MRLRHLAVVLLVPLCIVWLCTGLSAQTDGASGAAKAARTCQEIGNLIKAAGTADAYEGADVVRVFDRTDVDVEKSGLSHIRSHSLTKVLTAKGCLDLAARRFDYDPATNFIESRKIRVHRADGSAVDLPLDELTDAVQPAHAIYWGMRMKVISLPRLEIGDAVEIETYKKGFLIAYLGRAAGEDDERYIPPMRGHYYDMILFEEAIPIREKTYSVHTVRTRPLLYDVFNGECVCKTVHDEEKFHYTWSKRDIPAVHAEPRAPDNWDYATKVVMATVSTWEEKSRWFEKANREQFDSNEAIQAVVDDVVKDCADDDEKATALLRWVANNIRYSGLSMGKGEGYTLHPGWMILEERCGVCKDIAGMLVTMMRAAGIPAFPAMTMAGARVEHIPADQFNHCVVARRLPDGAYRMYDPTWCPMSMTDWSLAEAEQHYVVGSPEGEGLSQIAYHPPEDCLITVSSEGSLMADGTLEGKMTFEGRGYNDTFLRRILAGYDPKREVSSNLEGWLLRLSPRAELLGFEGGDHRDLTRPVTLSIFYRIPEYALVYGDTMEFSSPAAGVLLTRFVRAQSATRTPERTQPLFLYLAARHTVEETIKIPEGFLLSQAAKPRSIDGKGADLTTSVADGEGRVHISCTMAVKNRCTPPDHYPNLYDVMENLRAFAGETITVTAGPKR